MLGCDGLTHLHSPLGGLVGLHDVGVPQVDAVHGLQGAAHCGRGRGGREAAAGHELGVGCSLGLGGDQGAVVGHVDDLQGRVNLSACLYALHDPASFSI